MSDPVGKYRKSPDWADLAPVPQDDGPAPVVRILYSDYFVEVMDYFRAVLHADERSLRAYSLTEDVIKLNSANYTAWYFRRLCIDVVKPDLVEELKFVTEMALNSPKNYQLWQHRRWLLQKLPEDIRRMDLEHTASILEEDSKNYHAWAHRQWVIKTFGFWEDELTFTARMIKEDPYNNSAWNQRWFVLSNLDKIKPDSLDDELQYIFDTIEQAVSNASPWNYLSGLLDFVKYAEPVFSKAMAFMDSILKEHPNNVAALSFLVDVAQSTANTTLLEALPRAFALLADNDPVRIKYWEWSKSSVEAMKKAAA